MSPANRANADYSKGNSASRADFHAAAATRLVLLGVAAIGALLLIVSEFQTLYEVTVGTVVKKTVSGHSQHSFAILLIGLAALGMAFGIISGPRSRARPAMAAVALLGLVALLIALIGDLPDVNSTGLIGQLYAEASASAKIGFYMETLGAVALIFSGVALLFLSLSGEGTARPRRRAAAMSEQASPASAAGRGPVDAEDVGWL